ncbi:MAG: TOTE conflict system archaeo-eukaryotic primase domain-containing protein [Vicinamibacteraceae bacterium]
MLNAVFIMEGQDAPCGPHDWPCRSRPPGGSRSRRDTAGRRPRQRAVHSDRAQSYDRLFPNQDTLPQGGFGNLIALPLQKQPRDTGNTVFLDDQLQPWADQWAFLAGLHRIDRAPVERGVQEAERRGRILGVRLPPQEDGDEEPWTAPPSGRRKEPPIIGGLPQTLELVLGNQIYVPKSTEDIGKELDLVLDAILRSLTRRHSLTAASRIIILPRRPPDEREGSHVRSV